MQNQREIDENYGKLILVAARLFVDENFEEAKDLLHNETAWLIEYVQEHFEALDRISFSRANNDAYEIYLSVKNCIKGDSGKIIAVAG